MSFRTKAPWNDGLEYVGSNDDIEVTVIRSADGKTGKITIPLSSTLHGLKDAIGSDRTLGPLRRDQQRLFHLGRELKSGSRSLSSLGIGKHGVYSVHLHSLAPKTVDLQSDDEDGKIGIAKSGKKSVRRKSDVANDDGGGGVIDLAASSETSRSSLGGGNEFGNNTRNVDGTWRQQQQQPQRRQRREGGQEKVVELLDSDSDDDVEIIETVPKRRRRN